MPGYDLDPVKLAKRMDECLSYRMGENTILMGWISFRDGRQRQWRCGSLRHMMRHDEPERQPHDPFSNVGDFMKCMDKVVTYGFPQPGNLCRFVDLCAGLWNNDHPTLNVVESYRKVRRLLTEPGQLRTGSDFEARCLATVEALRPTLDDVHAWEQADTVTAPLLRIPPLTILGEAGPDWAFDLVCWNGANALAEQVRRPYGTAVAIANEGFHQPADTFGLVAPMTELMIRYEDVPEAPEATGAEIRRVLQHFRARAPWPVAAAPA